MTTTTLLRTPFHRFHVEHGAKMVEFAGWEMPMLYDSIIAEHRQVRDSGGLFDVSHMGRVRFRGPDAVRILDRLCTRDIATMTPGMVRYSLVCNDRGGCRDDVLVYRLGDDHFFMVVNASNRTKLLGHFEQVRGDLDVRIEDETMESGMLAVQGPQVVERVAGLLPQAAELKRYRFIEQEVLGATLLISRTGYTGEDGVEVIMSAALAEMAVEFLAGAEGEAIKPAGLGARDTLRMEAAMPLYGHEITEDLDPLAAGLHFAVALDKKTPFIGQPALARISRNGPPRTLAGLRLEGRRTARQGMAVKERGRAIGAVTSACLSPTLDVPIAMAYLDASANAPGRHVTIDLGRGEAPAEVVPLPFYKKT